MKPQRAFVAERALAQHCPELLGKTVPTAGELLPRLTAAGERFAKALAPLFGPFTSGEAPQVKASAARQDDDLMLGAEIGPLAANCLLAVGPQAAPLLVSFHAAAVLGMVDRTFGGRGLAPEVMPQKLPLSADLMVTRLEQIVIGCLTEALSLPDDAGIEPVRRDGSFSALAAFPQGAPLAVVRIDITEDSREPWPIFIVTSEEALPTLLADGASAPKRIKGRADPASEPFASLPLEITAMLVDMRISMATVAALEPGKIIPVSVARNVPLKIDGRVIATGSVGAADDSVAIRITQAFT